MKIYTSKMLNELSGNIQKMNEINKEFYEENIKLREENKKLREENKKLRKLLGLYEACITKGVDIDFPNSDIKAEQPFDINF